MATSSEAVRAELQIVMTAALADLASETAGVPLDQLYESTLTALGFIVPSYYDAAGALAVDWYEELREESRPASLYVPQIIGDPVTDWIERETEKYRRELDLTIEAEMAALVADVNRLTEKEVARGFRDSITGNTRRDQEAIGWSRVTRLGACRFCRMLAAKGAYFHKESTANFGAHTNCHCASKPEFRNGSHGPEADVLQYVAANGSRTPAQKKALRTYLYENFGGSKPEGYEAKAPNAALGFDAQSDQWVRDQIALTEKLKPSEWRTSQLARLRARLG